MRSSPADETNNPKVTTAASGDPGTDDALVAAAKTGDELAFETLIKRLRGHPNPAI